MTRWLPWLLLIAAAIVYTWRLGEMPTYVSPDEAIIAVDAHSLATTGRDVHGNALPLYFYIQVPPFRRLPASLLIVMLGACASAFVVHTHNYPGRMSIPLIPFACASAVTGTWLLRRSA